MMLAYLHAAADKLAAQNSGYCAGRPPADRVRAPAPLRSRDAIARILRGEFVILDFTANRAAHGEIREIAALCVGPGFAPVAEYNVLIEPERGVGGAPAPDDRHALSPRDAMRLLQAFVGHSPLFSEQASRNRKLLERAASRHGLRFDNPMYDSQLAAWSAWPGLPSYNSPELADLLGLKCPPTHRALARAQATLALLGAARQSLERW